MTLENLSRIAATATDTKRCPVCGSTWLGGVMGDSSMLICVDCRQEVPRRLALIAAAPEMAALLQECAEALEEYDGPYWPRLGELLARLADFDRSLRDRDVP